MASRELGFGLLWNLRRRARCRSLSITLIFATTALLWVACGNDGEQPEFGAAPETVAPTIGADPEPTPEPSPPASFPLAALPSISDLVEAIRPSVVSISVESVEQGFFFSYLNQGGATGTIVRPNGYIVTNLHVIQNARDIKVHVPNWDTYDALVVGVDALSDLAVLKIEAQDLPAVEFADSRRLRVGDWVVAVGNALALPGGPSVTVGIVSAKGRTIQTQHQVELFDLIQTDAAINEGNSGGPLVNMDGEVVGINTVIIQEAQAIGFAVSALQAQPIIEKLIEEGHVVRPLIGLNSVDVTPAIASDLQLPVDEGIIVTLMSTDSPAAQAGIAVGDVITKLDDIPTPTNARFLMLLWSYEPGDQVSIEYYRGDESLNATVTLAERQVP